MKAIIIIFICLCISIRGNETFREFVNGIYEALGEDKVIDEKCFGKNFDLLIEDIKSYMSVNNLAAFNENGNNILDEFQTEILIECDDVIYDIFDILILDKEKDNLYSMLLSNLITIEKLFVKYYKSDLKGGREMGQMIGGILKIIKDNKTKP